MHIRLEQVKSMSLSTGETPGDEATRLLNRNLRTPCLHLLDQLPLGRLLPWSGLLSSPIEMLDIRRARELQGIGILEVSEGIPRHLLYAGAFTPLQFELFLGGDTPYPGGYFGFR